MCILGNGMDRKPKSIPSVYDIRTMRVSSTPGKVVTSLSHLRVFSSSLRRLVFFGFRVLGCWLTLTRHEPFASSTQYPVHGLI